MTARHEIRPRAWAITRASSATDARVHGQRGCAKKSMVRSSPRESAVDEGHDDGGRPGSPAVPACATRKPSPTADADSHARSRKAVFRPGPGAGRVAA